MKVVVTGKQIDVGDALRSHVADRLRLGLGKYFNDGRLDTSVTFSRQGTMHRADCSVHLASEIYLQSHAEAADIYAAFDGAADRMEKQLRRYKRRLTNHHKRRLESQAAAWRAASYVLSSDEAEDADEHVELADDWQPVIIAETTLDIQELSVGEAVMRMDLADAPVLLFHNPANGHLNVVYRRRDGNVGWLDPATKKTGS